MAVSFGRAMAIYDWAESNFEYFDAWCCTKGIDPIDLPAYRFYNLVLFCLKEDKTDEGLKAIENSLALCDSLENPLKRLLGKPLGKDTPKRAVPRDKPKYIPSWWVGEQQSAATALSMMHKIPKKIGEDL